jgi:hypothetical protein
MDKASAQLKSPFWRGFKKDIDKSAKPAIVGLGVAFGNVFKGMAGVIDAFLPHMDGISRRMQKDHRKVRRLGLEAQGQHRHSRTSSSTSRTLRPGVAQFLGDLLGRRWTSRRLWPHESTVAMAVMKPACSTACRGYREERAWVIQSPCGPSTPVNKAINSEWLRSLWPWGCLRSRRGRR